MKQLKKIPALSELFPYFPKFRANTAGLSARSTHHSQTLKNHIYRFVSDISVKLTLKIILIFTYNLELTSLYRFSEIKKNPDRYIFHCTGCVEVYALFFYKVSITSRSSPTKPLQCRYCGLQIKKKPRSLACVFWEKTQFIFKKFSFR